MKIAELEQNPQRRLHRWLLAAVCLIAILLRYWGVDWPHTHPDEATIANWVAIHDHRDRIRERVYAEGFFHLFKPVRRLGQTMEYWRNAWLFFQRQTDAAEPSRLSDTTILEIRKFNAWLAAATVALLYALCLTVTRSRAAGLFGAAWLAVSPVHIEHSHYAETDVAMLFMLTLAMFLWARWGPRTRGWQFCVATFVTGLAIGTKFTLLPALICPLLAAFLAPADSQERYAASNRRLACAILMCLAGVVFFNRGMFDWKWFFPRVKAALTSVYGERESLGISDRWLAIRVNLRELAKGSAWLGGPCIAAVSFGAALGLTRHYRDNWLVGTAAPLTMLICSIFLAPWLRGQEVMIFYPFVGVWLAQTLAFLLNRNTGCPFVVLRRLTAGAAAALVLGSTFVTGMQQASLFAWPDPRVQAQEWLKLHAPPDRVLGFGSYTEPAYRGLKSRTVDIGHVERSTIAEIRTAGAQYIVRNPLSRGRGTVHPLTGERHPEFEKCWRDFRDAAQLIWSWSPFGRPAFCFAAMPLEYWGLMHTQAVMRLELPLFQPTFRTYSGRAPVWSVLPPMGSVKSVEVDRFPRRMIVAGPGPADRTVYLLLQTWERSAVVKVRGLGRRYQVELGPYCVHVVALRKPRFLPRLSRYDVITVQAKPVKHIGQIPCAAEVFLDQAQLVARLLQKGYADVALAWAKSAVSKTSIPDPLLWPAFAAATAQGDWTFAAALHSRVRALAQTLECAEAMSPENLIIQGVNGIYYDDHCRLRLRPFVAELYNRTNAGEIASDPLNLDVWPLPGESRLQLTLRWRGTLPSVAAIPVTVLIAGAQAKPHVAQLAPGAYQSILLELRSTYDAPLTVTFSAPCAGAIEIKEAEFHWQLRDALHAIRLELARALARWDLQTSQPEIAVTAITRQCSVFPEDLELRRLELAALLRVGSLASNGVAAAAAAIRQLAPNYVLPNTTSGAAPQIPSQQKKGWDFYPFLRLTRVRYLEQHRVLQCHFEVLRDYTPNSRVVLRKPALPNQPSRLAEQLIGDRDWLFRGEEYVVELPLSERYAPALPRLNLSVTTNPQWVPAEYCIVGRRQTRLKLGEIFNP